jgi:hypothetical protein
MDSLLWKREKLAAPVTETCSNDKIDPTLDMFALPNNHLS